MASTSTSRDWTAAPAATAIDRAKLWLEKQHLGLVLLPWLPTAISILGLKFLLLRGGGFHESALGLKQSDLSLVQKFLLFRADFLWCFVLIPIALLCATYFFRSTWRLTFVSLTAFVVGFGVFIETILYHATGTFPSFRTIVESLLWALKNRDNSFTPITLADICRFALWTAALVALTLIAFKGVRRGSRRANRSGLAIFGIAALVSIFAALPRASAMTWDRPLLDSISRDAFSSSVDSRLWARSVPELVRVYRQESHVPTEVPSALVGKAKGYNVIFFVMEAIPAQVFDPASDSLDDMPNVRRLRSQAFVSSRHYTTYPLTNRATFSIFSSLYTDCAAGCATADPVRLPGAIASLKDSGYQTGFYGYVWTGSSQHDDRMLRNLGFDKLVEPTIDPSYDREGVQTFTGPLSYVEKNDQQVLHSLCSDIRGWTSRKQPFAAAFFPEMGHDPWRAAADKQGSSLMERGHSLAVYQDTWLGTLIDELKRDGVLDNTIIVISADHGLRMVASGGNSIQAVSHGKLDDIVMRVPLLIYAPKVLDQTVKVDWPTSHIDVAPTVLDLLGVAKGREFEQGSAIWNPGLAQRRIFLAMDTFGASGYCDSGGCYMKSGMDTVFKTDHGLSFGDKDALPLSSPEAREMRDILASQNQLQYVLLVRLRACELHRQLPTL